MYSPTHFQEHKGDVLVALMRDHPLATVIRQAENGLVADHVPLLYKSIPDGMGVLLGHVAMNNPLWEVPPEDELLVVFQGVSTYISPSWYATKAEHQKVVPTWNYAVVHAYCTLEPIEEADALLDLLTELTDYHEASQAKPWRVSDAPIGFTQTLLKHIVGVRLTIHRWEGKWKVSQNQPPQNQQAVVNGLMGMQTDVHTQMAALVKSKGCGDVQA